VIDLDPRQLLASRLRALRGACWPGVKVKQAQLAEALSGSGKRPVSVPVIASWESPTNPKIPPTSRLEDIATFFATRRSFDGQKGRLLSLEELTEQERAVRQELLQELIGLRATALAVPRTGTAIPSVAQEMIPQSLNAGPYSFQDGWPITIVCAQLPAKISAMVPTARSAKRSYTLAERSYTDPDPSDPDFVELFRYSDLDSLFELFGHLRAANPTSSVQFRTVNQLRPDDYTGHLVSLGDVDWNEATSSLLDLLQLPVRQVSDWNEAGGAYFEVAEDDRAVAFRPWLDVRDGQETLREDIAFFARAVSPFNRKCFVIICNGMYGSGTYAAVRALTDVRFRDRNMEYIQRFASSEAFCILTRVTVENGFALTPDWTLPEIKLFEWARLQS
jgi:hypothetical protein